MRYKCNPGRDSAWLNKWTDTFTDDWWVLYIIQFMYIIWLTISCAWWQRFDESISPSIKSSQIYTENKHWTSYHHRDSTEPTHGPRTTRWLQTRFWHYTIPEKSTHLPNSCNVYNMYTIPEKTTHPFRLYWKYL